MKELIVFFDTAPQIFAQKPFLKKVRLQYLFNDKNLFRYHRDFISRWKLIFEESLVKDLRDALNSPDSFEYSFLETIRLRFKSAPFFEIDSFVKALKETVFDDIDFCSKIFDQIQSSSESRQRSLYEIVYFFLHDFHQQLIANNDSGDAEHWRLLNAFFRDSRGELTPFFRTLVANILFIKPAREHSELKKCSPRSLKKSHNNLANIYVNMHEVLRLLRSFFRQLVGFRELTAQARETLNKIEKQLKENYGVTSIIVKKNTSYGTVLVPYVDKKNFGMITHCHFLKEANTSAVQELLARLYAMTLITKQSVDLYQSKFITTMPYLTPVLEEDENDLNSDEEDEESLSSVLLDRLSSSSDSVRQRALSLDLELTSFGKEWFNRPEQQKWPSLIEKIASFYEWPVSFLKVTLSTLAPETFIPIPQDRTIFSSHNFLFQRKIFSFVKSEYANLLIEQFEKIIFGHKKLILPFMHPNISPISIYYSQIQRLSENKLFDYRCLCASLDTQTLITVLKFFKWPKNYNCILIKEAFIRGSKELLEMILREKPSLQVAWGQLFAMQLIWGDFDLVQYVINSSPEYLTTPDWLILLEWATQRRITCTISEAPLYQAIQHQFVAWTLQKGLENVWERIEPHKEFTELVGEWLYPQDSQESATFFQKKDRSLQLRSFCCWKEASSKNNKHLISLWELISKNERDPLSVLIAKICLKEELPIEMVMRQLPNNNSTDSYYSCYLLTLKTLLQQQIATQADLMSALIQPNIKTENNDLIVQRLKKDLTPPRRKILLFSIRNNLLGAVKERAFIKKQPTLAN